MARQYAGVAVVAASLLVAPRTFAVGFDDLGEATFAPGAVWTQSFETGELPVPDAGEAPKLEYIEDALHGKWVLLLEEYAGVDVPITLPSGAKSQRVSAWARGEVVASVTVEYTEGRVDQLGILYPTGRMTSDGWYEVETRGFSVDTERAKLIRDWLSRQGWRGRRDRGRLPRGRLCRTEPARSRRQVGLRRRRDLHVGACVATSPAVCRRCLPPPGATI
jgi:hypothetical protein